MKNSQLFSIVIAFALITSTAFAGNTKTETKDTSIDSSEELYVNPLEELLAMEAIPEIILDDQMNFDFSEANSSEEDYTNPLYEVVAMDAIPAIVLEGNDLSLDFELALDEQNFPLQEVLEMEAIPTVILTQRDNNQTENFDLLSPLYVNPLQEVLEMEAIPKIDLSLDSALLTLK